MIAVDNGLAYDPIQGEKGTFPFGSGPVINRFEGLKPDRAGFVNFADRKLVSDLKDAADKVGAQHYCDAKFNVYSDAGGANQTTPNIKSTYVGAPRRYSHSPYEVANLSGIKDTGSVLLEYFKSNWKAS